MIAVLDATRAEIGKTGMSRESLPAKIVQHIGEQNIRVAFRQYTNPKFLGTILEKFGKVLAAPQGVSLAAAVDDIIGNDIVPAMTVHKSKGLEFHTVIFLGLDDSQLWNFAKQSDEEKRGFFVALSRAITRVVFTFSDVRDGKFGRTNQERTTIVDLYTLLQSAGVETIDFRHRTTT